MATIGHQQSDPEKQAMAERFTAMLPIAKARCHFRIAKAEEKK